MKSICNNCMNFPCTDDMSVMLKSCPAFSPIPKPQTNANCIRSMDDKELAKVIKNPCDMGYYMPIEWCSDRNCGYQCSLDWLKKEVEDGE